MELTNQFRVGVPVATAWSILTDVERIAPCLPGAQLQEVDGDEYRGLVKVKVGPITAQYKGKATMVERDDARHVAVLKAQGRNTRDGGNASATITATLSPDGEATTVDVVTQLTITGKVAQFGRGVLADVSSKILDQFVECLESDMSGTTAQGAPAVAGEAPLFATGAASDAWDAVAPLGAGRTPPGEEEPLGVDAEAAAEAAPRQDETRAEPAPRKVDHQEAAPVDLFEAAGVPMAKRAIPLVGGILVILWFLRRRRTRR